VETTKTTAELGLLGDYGQSRRSREDWPQHNRQQPETKRKKKGSEVSPGSLSLVSSKTTYILDVFSPGDSQSAPTNTPPPSRNATPASTRLPRLRSCPLPPEPRISRCPANCGQHAPPPPAPTVQEERTARGRAVLSPCRSRTCLASALRSVWADGQLADGIGLRRAPCPPTHSDTMLSTKAPPAQLAALRAQRSMTPHPRACPQGNSSPPSLHMYTCAHATGAGLHPPPPLYTTYPHSDVALSFAVDATSRSGVAGASRSLVPPPPQVALSQKRDFHFARCRCWTSASVPSRPRTKKKSCYTHNYLCTIPTLDT